MRFEPALCPQCGKDAVSILETVLVEAQLDYDAATGTYDYAGESDVLWDTQEPSTDDFEKTVTLRCGNGHVWHPQDDTTQEATG